MPDTETGGITLGPGGKILDVEPNRKLLAQLQEKSPLTSAELIRYAKYLSAYRSNLPTADYLFQVALATQISNPDIQAALVKAGIPIQANITADDIEDFFDHGADEGPKDRTFLPIIQWISSPDGGFLVETSSINGSEGSHIIAFCPSSDKLP